MGLSQGEVAELLGVSQASLSRMERGLGPVSADVIYNFACKFPEVDLREILCGVPTASSPDAISVAANVRPIIRALGAPISDLPPDGLADDYLAVPLVDGRIAAGAGGVVWDEVASLVWVYRPEIGRRFNLVAVRVMGDSMHPTIPDKAIVIIDKDDRLANGMRRAVWAVRTGPEGDVAIKRILKAKTGKASDPPVLFLMSDNPDSPPFVAWTSATDELVLGRVVWMWRSL
ncbi:MAG: XRE family transcriptional regulator [Deltaproteobacteria bacterium]|nr:XRE family transcriptional regulator [Deltaproteobacteria bacterium]